ncbi:MAG: ABC transporter permease [Caldisericia bacterium]
MINKEIILFWKRFKRDKQSVISMFILLCLFVFALIFPWIAKYTPFQLVSEPFQKPNLKFPFGTDDLGRDIFSQVFFGMRITFIIGFLASIIAGLLGIIVGALAGYFQGNIFDFFISGIIEIFQSIPLFFLSIVLIAIFGPRLLNVILALGLTLWPGTARIIRAQFLYIKELQFVEAAKVIGENTFNIIFKEIFPNAIPPAIVNIAYCSSVAIVVESGLSFLGLGDPNHMSLGYIIGNAKSFIYQAWWLSLIPGFFLFLIILSLNLVVDGLNDALNPKLREEK